jgi:nicotinate phosphoribosyltransferase
MFDPNYPFLNKTVEDFIARPLLKDIFVDGQQVYQEPSMNEIRQARQRHLDRLWEEYKRNLNPEVYPVDLSQKCYDNKMKIIKDVKDYIKHLN